MEQTPDDPQVAAALARLCGLDETPVHEQAAVYADIQERLHQVLAAASTPAGDATAEGDAARLAGS